MKYVYLRETELFASDVSGHNVKAIITNRPPMVGIIKLQDSLIAFSVDAGESKIVADHWNVDSGC